MLHFFWKPSTHFHGRLACKFTLFPTWPFTLGPMGARVLGLLSLGLGVKLGVTEELGVSNSAGLIKTRFPMKRFQSANEGQ